MPLAAGTRLGPCEVLGRSAPGAWARSISSRCGLHGYRIFSLGWAAGGSGVNCASPPCVSDAQRAAGTSEGVRA